jgi:hypothetical protein
VSAVSVNFTGKDPHEPSSEHPPGAFVTTSAAQVQSTIDEERIQLIMERVFAEKATPFLERLQKDIGDIKVHEVIEKMDRYIDHALKAAHKYLELSGESVTAYRFIGYTYWWFKDTDTAIQSVHCR